MTTSCESGPTWNSAATPSPGTTLPRRTPGWAVALNSRTISPSASGLPTRRSNAQPLLLRQGDSQAALADLSQAFHTLRDTGTDFGTVECLERYASVAVAANQPDRALLIWGSIDAWRSRTGYVVSAGDRARRETERAAAEAMLARAAPAVLASSPALTLDQACQVALHVTTAAADPRQTLDSRRPAAPSSPMPAPSPLSRRETQVLALIAESLSNQEIAERMFISTSTAMKHVEHIFEKLGVNRRMEAVRVGRQSGWLPSDS